MIEDVPTGIGRGMTDQRITRRTAIAAAAWTAPAIALAVTAPASSASATLACPVGVRAAVVVPDLDPSDWHVFLTYAWWTISSKYFGIDTTLVDPAVYGTTYELTMLGGTTVRMSNGGGGTMPWYMVGSTFVGAVGTVAPLPFAANTIGDFSLQVVPDLYDPNSGVDVSIDAADAWTLASLSFTAELRFTSPDTGETVSCVYDFAYDITSSFTGGPIVNGHGHLQLTGTIAAAP